MAYQKRLIKRRRNRKLVRVVVAALILFSTLFTYFYFHLKNLDTTPTKASSSASVPVTSKGDVTPPKTTNNEKGNSSDTAQTMPTSNSTNPPKTPYGNFVSNHNPKSTDSEQSTCTTSPGASCTISFTKDGAIKKLDHKTTDSDGTAYWLWSLKDIGIREGTWQITVTSNLNGKDATANDTRDLVVTP